MTYTFPAAARRYVRSPNGTIDLVVKTGALPDDLRGFVYVVAPTGREVETEDRPGFVPFLNGDGTVYRIEFIPPTGTDAAKAQLRWALTKPPCYWAEIGAESDDAFEAQRARDWGITRLFDDLGLGGRNLLNTALQAVRFGGDTDRLLVTYESGRPFEIDPVSLEVLTPIGQRSAWRATLMGGTPFELVAGTSHPAFDPKHDARGGPGSGTVFMLNFVRDASLYAERLLRFLDLDDEYRFLNGLAAKVGLKAAVDSLLVKAFTRHGPPGTASFWSDVVKGTLEAWSRFKERTPFVDASSQLLFWDGASEPGAVTLLDEKGEPLSIRESGHQMGVTENYVVITDAAFKFEMDLVFPDLDVFPDTVLEFVRRRLSRIQPQSTRFHFIPRGQLKNGASVRVQTVELPCSCVHYFVNREDEGGKNLVLYAVDNAACDSSEALMGSDRPAFGVGNNLPNEVFGMIPCSVDVDRLVRYELDLGKSPPKFAVTGHAADVDTMWTVALVTGPTQYTALDPKPVEDLYFFTHGLLPSAVSELIWDLYERPGYARRLVSRDDVRSLALAGGVAPAVCRYEASTPDQLADSYTVDKGWLALSPQWVPGGTGGYLFTTAFGKDEKEIWVFDAANLRKGPIATLGAPPGEELPWAYTLHTTYLEQAVARPATGQYRVSVEDDLVGIGDVPPIIAEHVIDKAYKPVLPTAAPVRRSLPAKQPTAAPLAATLPPNEVLERVRATVEAIGKQHPLANSLRIDDAVLGFQLEVLRSIEADTSISHEGLAAALAMPNAPKRDAIFSAMEDATQRIVHAIRPLDRIILPASLSEADVGSTLARLGERALRGWSFRPLEEVRSQLTASCHAYAGLFRADPQAPGTTPCSRVLAAQGAWVNAGGERRVVDGLVSSVLGPGF